MEKRDSDILFEYLKDILFCINPDERRAFDPDQLSENSRRLGEGLQVLDLYVQELRDFSTSLSRGELDTKIPSRENTLCWPLKALQSNLLHLAWQTRQVAHGDYSQKVAFLGDFSASFNDMIHQLSNRESELKDSYELLAYVANSMKRYILILDSQTKETLFQNTAMENIFHYSPALGRFLKNSALIGPPKGAHWECSFCDDSEKNAEDQNIKTFSFDLFLINYSNKKAAAYIMEDITSQKVFAQHMTNLAYLDSNTQLYNSRYFRKKFCEWLEQKRHFCLCYLDLDRLKYVNDNFGHEEGDFYIHSLANLLNGNFRDMDIISRIGGDEFTVLMHKCSAEQAEIKFQRIFNQFESLGENHGKYPMSFSYGIVEVTPENMFSDTDLLAMADKKMYQFKHSSN